MLLISGGVVKSGSVALYQYIREIVETHRGIAPIMTEGNEDAYFDDTIEYWVKTSWTNVVKLHSWRDSLGPYAHNDRMKVVMTYRDLRDTCLSVRDFRNDHFEGVIASGILQRIRDSELTWREKMGDALYPVPYEEMRLNPALTIGKIAAFIGIDISPVEAQKIAVNWSIHANRARAAAGYHYTHPEFMSPRHISSGNVGRWRTELMPEQCHVVQEHVGEDWFTERGYELV